MIFRFLFILAAIIFQAAPSMAAEPLIFRDKPSNAREESLIAYLVSENKLIPDLPYTLAATDLNGDGVDEWIVRQNRSSACETNSECGFMIAALRKNLPVLLGEFQARQIDVSDDTLYGIRKLLVYNKKNDDFAYTTYMWDPEKSEFSDFSDE